MKEGVTYIRFVNLKNSTIFLIGKFTILWNIFEDEMCGCACSYDNILAATKNIKEDERVAFTELAIELKKRVADVSPTCTVQQYVEEKLYPNDKRARISKKEREDYSKRVVEYITSNGEEALNGALLAIWRIRNNMFHGLKGHAILDDQANLFETMCSILEKATKQQWE